MSQAVGQAALQVGIRLGGWILGEHSVGLPQPRVTWQRDRQGHSSYHIYDPVSQTQHQFDTAQEARAWLETRYYR